jgi:hypothetical protein
VSIVMVCGKGTAGAVHLLCQIVPAFPSSTLVALPFSPEVSSSLAETVHPARESGVGAAAMAAAGRMPMCWCKDPVVWGDPEGRPVTVTYPVISSNPTRTTAVWRIICRFDSDIKHLTSAVTRPATSYRTVGSLA